MPVVYGEISTIVILYQHIKYQLPSSIIFRDMEGVAK